LSIVKLTVAVEELPASSVAVSRDGGDPSAVKAKGGAEWPLSSRTEIAEDALEVVGDLIGEGDGLRGRRSRQGRGDRHGRRGLVRDEARSRGRRLVPEESIEIAL